MAVSMIGSKSAIAQTRQTVVVPQTKVSLSGNALAGLAGGFVSSIIMHPLDVVTTRMQAQDGRISHIPKYANPISALRTIVRTEGFSHLYVGVVPNVTGSMVCWGINFTTYNYLKSYIRRNNRARDGVEKDLGPVENLACATAAGAVAACATQPIWLVKTRLELQEGSLVQYNGMLHCFREIVKNEGFSALLRGLVPSLMLVSHIALHFMAYEEFKILARRYNGGKEHLSNEETCAAASAAKLFATSVTYPTQVVRTRLQQVDPMLLRKAVERLAVAGGGAGGGMSQLQCHHLFTCQHEGHYYKGVGDAMHKIVKFEGARGLYKGLGANFVRVIPTTAITFVVYEAVAKALGVKT